jgi:two-component system chemotaxis response regulator CheB
MAHRDIVVVGTSMGGVEALTSLAAQLPADFPAALFVVMHIAPDAPSVLARILNRSGPLPAKAAEDGEPVARGRIYVAPPDRHLLVRPGHVHLSRGPRENRSRPAVDVLFRSAAAAYGPRVVGVVLTGLLDDGAAGLFDVKRRGGLAVVQDPDDALYASMPRSALRATDVDHVVPLVRLGGLLDRIVREAVPSDALLVPGDLLTEVQIAEADMSNEHTADHLGHPSMFSCPECGGTLYEISTNGPRRYRCLIGHAYTARTLLAEQGLEAEHALLAAIRTMEQRAGMLEALARDKRGSGRQRSATSFDDRAAETRQHAEKLRALLHAFLPTVEGDDGDEGQDAEAGDGAHQGGVERAHER